MLSILKRKYAVVTSYKKLFDTPEGKTVLYDLMKKGFMLQPTHDDDRSKNDKNEGKRELVLYILTTLETDPNRLLDAMKAGQSEDEKYE